MICPHCKKDSKRKAAKQLEDMEFVKKIQEQIKSGKQSQLKGGAT